MDSRSIRSLIDFFGRKVKEDNITAYAAQATLFIIMSAIPFLLVFLSLLRFTPVTEDMVLSIIRLIIPGTVAPWIIQIIDEVYHYTGGVLIVALVMAVYSAAKCIHSLRNGLNIIYGVNETRNWFKLRLRAMLETFALVMIIILVLVLVFFGEKIKNLAANYIPAIQHVTNMLLRGRIVIIFFVLIIVFTFIYRFLPNRPATLRSQLVGAVLCTVAWYFFTFGLSFVVHYLNGFTIYGSLTTIVLVMFWLDVCMTIFMFCGEINNGFEMIVAEFRMARARKRKKEESQKNQSGES